MVLISSNFVKILVTISVFVEIANSIPHNIKKLLDKKITEKLNTSKKYQDYEMAPVFKKKVMERVQQNMELRNAFENELALKENTSKRRRDLQRVNQEKKRTQVESEMLQAKLLRDLQLWYWSFFDL